MLGAWSLASFIPALVDELIWQKREHPHLPYLTTQCAPQKIF